MKLLRRLVRHAAGIGIRPSHPPVMPLAALAFVVVGCATFGALGAPTEPATLKVGMPFLSQPPDPARGGFTPVQAGLAETLFRLGRDLKPQPWLAEGAQQVDERTWEIRLRAGVTFHDGGLMDAAAVKASIERAVAMNPSPRVLLDIASIEVKDRSTLIVATRGPSPVLPGMLTDPATAIVSAAAATAMGDAFTDRAVLTGPFKVERYQQDHELVVARNPGYWGAPPQAERVHFLYLPDNQTRLLALQSGDIDIAVYMAPESLPAVHGSSSLAVKRAAPVALEFLYLNHRREPLKDMRLRQAIAQAISREGLVNGVMRGEGIAATGVFPPTFLTCDQRSGLLFDPAQAKRLLADTGYRDADGDGYLERDGQTLTLSLLTYRQRPELVPMAEAIQASLRAIGIRVSIGMVEQINEAMERGDWDAALYFNNMVTTGDPSWALSQFFATGGPANRGRYTSAQLDPLVSQLGQARGQAERERLACQASHLAVEEVAIVPLLYPHYHYAVSNRVVGLEDPHPFFLYFVDIAIGKR